MKDETIKQIGGMGMGLLGGITGAVTGNQNWKRQKQAMGMQHANQMELNKQGSDLAFDMWNKTNYGAQVQHMKDAGLNVGLMYEGGGAGGTTSAGSGGSASMVQPTESNAGGMGMQAMMMQSSIELNKAMANKANAEATKTAGVDTENTTANTSLTKMNEANARLANELSTKTLEDVVDTVRANRDIALAESGIKVVEGRVTTSTEQAQIKKINADANNEVFKLTLMKADEKLTEEKTRAISVELSQEWERLSIELDKVGIGKMGNAIQEFTAKVNARLGQGNLNMRGIEAGLQAGASLLKGVKIPEKKVEVPSNPYTNYTTTR